MRETGISAGVIDPKLKDEILEIVKGALKEALETDVRNDASLTEKEAAELMGVRPQAAALWRSKGVGPDYYHAGRSVRYIRSDVLEFREKQKVRTNVQGAVKGDSE